jgi:N-acetylglucosamine-6-phosphate deacetylase
MKKAIINSKIFTGKGMVKDAVIVVEDGKIIGLQKEVPPGAGIIDIQGKNIAPGFIDIQVNGGERLYFSGSPSDETLHDICDSSLKFGATHTLPCLISSPREEILEAIEAVRKFMAVYDKGVLGMHLEGPFINPEKRGAHNPNIIRKPTNTELEEIIYYGKGVIKVMTIAPEQFTDDQIDLLLDSGIILSAGHSTTTYEQAQYYFDKGIHLVTHLYNAMTQMGHRSPGTVGAVFDNDAVYAPIILDGAHCDYAAARIAYKIKRDKLFLISDAAFLGRQVTEFNSEVLDAKLVDGFYRNKNGNLAGAAISMAEAVQNALRHLNCPLEDAINMATIYVAKAIRMENEIGKIETGYPSAFICFNDDFTDFKTMVL